uniref:DZF domain-containing protein n=1 Tax=Globodera pallida TaxID=36090 RepID=A0A183C7H0_GLOPA
MFGYQQTQFNYGAYASANGQQQSFINYAQQQNNAATAAVAGTATTNAYAASQYSLAASAYAQYSQAATQQQQQTVAGYGVQPPPPPPDYSASSNTGTYGVIGGGKATGANATSAATGANAAHYTGYEAAVYAAASSYLQSKNHGASGNWVNKAPGGNYNKEFRKKRYGLGHQNRDVQQYFCEVCKISCAGQAAYKDHMDGKPHKKKEMASKNKSAVPIYKGIGFRCEVCELTCSSKDTYDAHIKGQKHQRTVALLRRMGKPVPEQVEMSPAVVTSANAQALGKPIPTVGGNVPLKKVVGVTGTKFVGGTTLTTTGEELKTVGNPVNAITGAMKPQDLEKALLADVDIKPIGQEYIEEETDISGKFLNYNCKLCDCKFSDKNAKDIHLKGRRHRLQYKVEMKQWGGSKKQQQKQKFGGAYAMTYQPPPQQPRPFVPMQRGHEIMDDQHVLHKLQQIQLSMDEVKSVERLAIFAEKTLKAVSDVMLSESGCPAETQEEHRVLKGVMRVGLLAKHLMLKTDNQIDLVVLCSKIPNITLLKLVVEYFQKHAEVASEDQLSVAELLEESAFAVSLGTIPFTCRVTLTCVLLREAQPKAVEDGTSAASQVEEMTPTDPLPKEPCLNALAELRHAKFFQAKCAPLHSVNSTVKIVRDIGNRVQTWSALNCWAIELLVEKTLASMAMPLSPGDAVRRLFEVISSGQFLSKRSKLIDPCEKEQNDVFSHITDQEREDITSSAQHAIRLIAYNQLYKILGIDRLPDSHPPPAPPVGIGGAATLKRPMSRDESSANGGGGPAGAASAAADSSSEEIIAEKKMKLDDMKKEDPDT